jgi:sec-independent protein translocase protein TatA
MNFFNIGTAELLLIFAIALIVVGPRRLPEIAQSLGKIVSDIRKISREFTTDMMREVNAPPHATGNEAKEIPDHDVSEKPVQSLGEIVSDVKKMSRELTEEITRDLTVSLDSKEDGAKKVADQNVPKKPDQGDQA